MRKYMKILFDIGHPAHVHLFRYPMQILRSRGHETFVICRHKDVAINLLQALNIKYYKGTTKRSGLASVLELFEWFAGVYKLIKKLDIDVVASIGSPGGSWAAKFQGIPHLTFNDTEKAFSQRLFYKIASKSIFTPDAYQLKLGKKHFKYKGFHELSYLRPEYFTPDPGILDELGVEPDEPYVIMRFVKWGATHDYGQSGISQYIKHKAIEEFSKRARVFITSEDKLPSGLEKYHIKILPERIHHAMYYASLYFGESPTMTTESAILGTPAICVSSWACECGNFIILKEHYDLIECFKNGERALEFGLKCLDNKVKTLWQTKALKLIEDTIDVAMFIADAIENKGMLTTERNKI